MVRLDPMSAQEYDAFLAWSIPEYAAEHVRAGNWDPAKAIELAQAEHAQLLPKGPETPDHYLRTIVKEPDGKRVGEVWYAVRKQGPVTELFLYWIGIDEAHRRHGYAAEALGQIEREALRLGATRMALHVFGGNTAAQTLYAKLGYSTTNVLMAKELGSQNPP
jgi:RimJ/RimL family protein N-acetyltransferase